MLILKSANLDDAVDPVVRQVVLYNPVTHEQKQAYFVLTESTPMVMEAVRAAYDSGQWAILSLVEVAHAA